jgi:hypothetical protein
MKRRKRANVATDGEKGKSEKKQAKRGSAAGDRLAARAADPLLALALPSAVPAPAAQPGAELAKFVDLAPELVESRRAWAARWAAETLEKAREARKWRERLALMGPGGADEDDIDRARRAEIERLAAKHERAQDWALGRALFGSIGDPAPAAPRGRGESETDREGWRESPSMTDGPATLSLLLELAKSASDEVWERESWLAERLAAWLRAEGPKGDTGLLVDIASAFADPTAERSLAAAEIAFGPFSVSAPRWITRKSDRSGMWTAILSRMSPEAARAIAKRDQEALGPSQWPDFVNAMIAGSHFETIDALGVEGFPIEWPLFNGASIERREREWAQAAAGLGGRRDEEPGAGGGEAPLMPFWRAIASRALASGMSSAFVGLLARQEASLSKAMLKDDELARQVGDMAILVMAGTAGYAASPESAAAAKAFSLVPEGLRARPRAWLCAQAARLALEGAVSARSRDWRGENEGSERAARISRQLTAKIRFLAQIKVSEGAPTPGVAMGDLLEALSATPFRLGKRVVSCMETLAEAAETTLAAWGLEDLSDPSTDLPARDRIETALEGWFDGRAPGLEEPQGLDAVARLGRALGGAGYAPSKWAQREWSATQAGLAMLSAAQAAALREVAEGVMNETATKGSGASATPVRRFVRRV